VPTLNLPVSGGQLSSYTTRPPKAFPPAERPFNRIAYAAAHVVADPLAERDPWVEAAIDWDATMNFRRHLWSLGLGLAEAMDTAQRGMGLDWPTSLQLIQRTLEAARDYPGALIGSGAGTDHLAPGDSVTIDDVIAAYEEQCSAIEKLGGRIILMASRALVKAARSPDDYARVYDRILGQVKKAYSTAAELGATTRHLNKLFQHAFRVAKHVRSETQITRGATSVGAVAVELAGKIFGNLAGRRVMILGAGETSERTARSLVSRGVKTVIVSNRTFDRAAKLAEEIGGLAIHFDHWQNAFADVDILICSTAAPHVILTPEKLAPLIRARAGRPLFVIDLAFPRDADPAINELDGVFLYDIDSLEGIVRQSLDVRRSEIIRCEQMITDQVSAFVSWLRHHHELRA
jgi:glutamyl-tRNA reductase